MKTILIIISCAFIAQITTQAQDFYSNARERYNQRFEETQREQQRQRQENQVRQMQAEIEEMRRLQHQRFEDDAARDRRFYINRW